MRKREHWWFSSNLCWDFFFRCHFYTHLIRLKRVCAMQTLMVMLATAAAAISTVCQLACVYAYCLSVVFLAGKVLESQSTTTLRTSMCKQKLQPINDSLVSSLWLHVPRFLTQSASVIVMYVALCWIVSQLALFAKIYFSFVLFSRHINIIQFRRSLRLANISAKKHRTHTHTHTVINTIARTHFRTLIIKLLQIKSDEMW